MPDIDLAVILGDGDYLKRDGAELVGAPLAPVGAIPLFATFDVSTADAYPEYAFLLLEMGPDLVAPTVPTGLTAEAGDTQVVLTWTESTDNIGVVGYRVYVGGVLDDTSAYPTYTVTGLTNGVAYSFTVAAFDDAGNTSAQSGAVVATPEAPVIVDTPPAIPWHAAWWAEDPAWTAPADAGLVASWRDYTGGTRHLVNADSTRQPAYRSSRPLFNNKPALEFRLDTLSVPITVTAPYTVVVIGRMTATSSLLVAGSDTTHNSNIGVAASGATWRMSAGTELVGGTWNNVTHLFRGYFNGATSLLQVDGATVVSGNIGTQIPTMIRVSSNTLGTSWFNNDVAFIGIYQGDVTTAPNWAAFVTWAARYTPTLLRPAPES